MKEAWAEGEMLGMGAGGRSQGHSKMIKTTVREGEVSKMQGCPGASPYWLSSLTACVPSQVCTQGCHVGSFKPAVGGVSMPQKSRKRADQGLFSPESWLFNIYQRTIAATPAASPAVGGPESCVRGICDGPWARDRLGEVEGREGIFSGPHSVSKGPPSSGEPQHRAGD